MSETIHFIGVGKMGLPMASHLLAAGHTVTVSDPDHSRLALAAEAGAASTPLSATSSSHPPSQLGLF